ncbi:MAG: hydantoinase B/oxoprolinase family protein [Alphaproteobacteria bacterium]|nr:hydantoinase B/oxoprolinase family protein [Alphaproteobacteria bacterium]
MQRAPMTNSSQTLPRADAIQLEVFSNRLLAIAEEMGRRLVRSSFSPNIKERRDCSAALFAADGRLIAQAAHIPIHLGSLFGAVAAIVDKFPLERMQPGDAFIANDAYLCAGTHLNDISIVQPVFVEGRVQYFAACIGHHTDVGGPTPGSIAPDAASIFEEGIRIPATQVVRAGETDRGLIELIAHNTREPEIRILDLDVQIAVSAFGAKRMADLAAKEGGPATAVLADALLAYARRRLGAAILALPDGEYSHTVWMDDDGLGGDPLPIRATLHVVGDVLSLDFAGSGPQSRGGFNLLPSGVMATVGYAVKALLDPDLPPNSGLFDAIQLRIPEGTILNPHFPAAVGARTTTCQKLASAIFGALQPALPASRAMAASHDILASMVFGGDGADGRPYVYLETIGGGNGALTDADGMDGAHCHITNSLNTPAEAVENSHPLRVVEYALVEGSGGAGAMRGGMGIARELEAVGAPASFSSRGDNFKTAPSGAHGGGEGGRARVILHPDTANPQIMDTKQRRIALAAGARVRLETPGGGGYGAPADRPIAALAADLADGRINHALAVEVYGEALTAKAKAMIQALP